jgi:hypothetical protein
MDLDELRAAVRPVNNTLVKKMLRAMSWTVVRPYLRTILSEINLLHERLSALEHAALSEANVSSAPEPNPSAMEVPEPSGPMLAYGSVLRGEQTELTAVANRLAQIEDQLAVLEDRGAEALGLSRPSVKMADLNARLLSVEAAIERLAHERRDMADRLAKLEASALNRADQDAGSQ